MRLRHLQAQRAAFSSGGEHSAAPQGHRQIILRAPRVHLHRHPRQIGSDAHRGHRAQLRHGLQPNRLPNAGHRGVPHPMGTPVLLAVGVVMGQGVHRLDLQAVLPGAQHLGNVGGKGQIAPLVAHHALPVQPDLRHLVHRPEVEHCPPSRRHKALRQGKGGFIAQHLPRLSRPAGQGSLGRPGNLDGPSIQRPALI